MGHEVLISEEESEFVDSRLKITACLLSGIALALLHFSRCGYGMLLRPGDDRHSPLNGMAEAYVKI
jgi:hypothetical protein